ncbi:MAG: fused MFS/spermidine synthase [Verrucomicrobiota bacterium]
MRLIAITIFISSFLVFQIEPLIAKYILSWFGGAAEVWTACMLFFQLALFGGYLYAHFLSTHFSFKWQVILHGLLLVVSLLALPVTPASSLRPDDVANPALWVILVLIVSIGAPFFLLSSTAPLMQSWFSRAFPKRSAYRLYALSNFGSLLGLFIYPFVVERLLRLPVQTWFWSLGYLMFVIICVATGWSLIKIVAKQQQTEECTDDVEQAVGEVAPRRGFLEYINIILWVILSFCGSVMLLSVTNQLCQNIAAVPFLWVLPLGIYLLTFILCFERDAWYRRGIFVPLWLIALGVGLWQGFEGSSWPIGVQVAAYGYILFVSCMVCHGELARLRPQTSQLTLFYVWISFGGLLGGFFVSLVAPMIFTLFYEFYVGLVGTGIALVFVLRENAWRNLAGKALKANVLKTGVAGAVIASIFIGFTWLGNLQGLGGGNTIAIYRDFFGIASVQRLQTSVPGKTVLAFTDGNTTHGFQYESPENRADAVGYYRETSGVGLAFKHYPRRIRGEALRVGVIGLGVGSLAVYAKPGDEFQFYELNPNVEWFARQFFTNLYDAEKRNVKIKVFLGDGRLKLERRLEHKNAGQYDILIIDAFSSDAIPVHLLTEEAFVLYKKHLKPDGILAIHISNRHLDLAPVVRSAVTAIGIDAAQFWGAIPTSSILPESLLLDSHWILATSNKQFLNQAEILEAQTPWEEGGKVIHWTDNFSSLFQVLK